MKRNLSADERDKQSSSYDMEVTLLMRCINGRRLLSIEETLRNLVKRPTRSDVCSTLHSIIQKIWETKPTFMVQKALSDTLFLEHGNDYSEMGFKARIAVLCDKTGVLMANGKGCHFTVGGFLDCHVYTLCRQVMENCFEYLQEDGKCYLLRDECNTPDESTQEDAFWREINHPDVLEDFSENRGESQEERDN